MNDFFFRHPQLSKTSERGLYDHVLIAPGCRNQCPRLIHNQNGRIRSARASGPAASAVLVSAATGTLNQIKDSPG